MNPEGTPLADRAVYADPSPVHLSNVFDDGEAESGSTHCAATVAVHPVKPLE